MTFKELLQSSGMSRQQFSRYFGIPYRTVQNWDLGIRSCPDYLLRLMEYKLKKEELAK
jgi:DNA-binding transcriptional regulator YiaG